MPVNTEINVVFPAPFGPKNPKIYPLFNFKFNSFKATLPISPLLFSYIFFKSKINKGSILTLDCLTT